MAVSVETITAALATVIDPELRAPITELDMVDRVEVSPSVVSVSVVLTIVGCPAAQAIERDVRQALESAAPGREIDLSMGVMSPERREGLITRLRSSSTTRRAFTPDSLTRVIAVTSGKGGVGKSSVTINLAAAVAQQGFRVGVIDADVFGFSIPGLVGLQGVTPTRLDDMILPPVAFDMKILSIGMFLEKDQAVAWRGPLLHRTLEQFLTEAYFGDLDFLFLDLPPGTGDIAISVGQLLPQAEIIVVTTPQKSAADVAWRSGDVARQTGQKVLGVIENMSATTLADGTVLDVFGSGGGQETASRLGVPLMGHVPLSPALREAGDAGTPLVLSSPDSPAAREIQSITSAVIRGGESRAGKNLPFA
ncbi:Mrp/NBP35 family ATP-binding protein [Pontimonas sp.]|nr:Mrp/NBP35 family ATP-binding protein [Pontimonas sp.]